MLLLMVGTLFSLSPGHTLHVATSWEQLPPAALSWLKETMLCTATGTLDLLLLD